MNNEQYQRTRQWHRWQVGDVVIFKREGKLAAVLSMALKAFYPKWDRYGWHGARLVEKDDIGWWIMEATGSGVGKKRFIINGYISEDYDRSFRLYHWLDKTPDKAKVDRFIKDRLNEPYDVGAYFGTVISLILKVFGREGRWHDRQHHCIELLSEFDRAFGKPWCGLYQYPVLPLFTELAGHHYYSYTVRK